MNREEAEKVLNAIDFKDGDNIVIINKNVCDKMKNEKQQLIKFLEDKIKETNELLRSVDETTYLGAPRFCVLNGQLDAYQEVLDFVNKGGKDE